MKIKETSSEGILQETGCGSCSCLPHCRSINEMSVKNRREDTVPPDKVGYEYWTRYYEEAEAYADEHFEMIRKCIGSDLWSKFNFDITLDFACGVGRMAERFSKICKILICCDVEDEAIKRSRERLSKLDTYCLFSYLTNSSDQIKIKDDIISFVYSWDAMVHFDLSLIYIYTNEFHRILEPGEYGFIHHSNYAGLPWFRPGYWKQNPHGRENVSAADVRRVLTKSGLSVVAQSLMKWEYDDLDCITVFRKPLTKNSSHPPKFVPSLNSTRRAEELAGTKDR